MKKIVYIISCDDLWEFLEETDCPKEIIEDTDFDSVSDEQYKAAVDAQGWVLSLDRFVEAFNADSDLAPTSSYHYIRIYDA
jgi:hypothetical protein